MKRAIESLDVYPVGLGAMPLSLADRPEEGRAREVIAAALAEGIDFIDTADCYCRDDGDYGHNERLIASVLREQSRTGDVAVATKGGVTRPGGDWLPDGRPQHLRAACEASLRNLGVEAIELYYLHAPDPRVPFEDSVGELARLREEGKIRRLGLSNVDAGQLEAALAIAPVAAVQNRCNILEKGDLNNGLVALCAREGIAYVAYSPAGGHNGHVRLGQVEALNDAADRHGVGNHSIALAWLLAQDDTIIPIAGASRPESVRASAAAARLRLDEDELEQLGAIPDWQD